ncbi:hypothetical protein K2Z84_29085 [Candidatus Binatia bacterium]|nr:hypothetical protein [Candidatus Binatia bacterium]
MTHHATPAFWGLYRKLPAAVRELADQAFSHLKRDPRHPSLRVKKVGRFWSARLGAHHRALAVEAPDGLVWFWIGTHAEYDQLLG